MGRYMGRQSNLEPFIKTGTTLVVLSIDGKEPEEKERLNKLAIYLEILVTYYSYIVFT